jgi:hypothetical protein
VYLPGSREMADQEVNKEFIERVDEAKRSSVRKMAGLAFVVPVVASFAMAGLSVNEAHAQSYGANGGGVIIQQP